MSALSWLCGRLAAPMLGVAAILFALGFAWQTGRIDGWPLLGGGYKAELAALGARAAAKARQEAEARAALLLARQKFTDAGHEEARLHAAAARAGRQQMQILMRKVPLYVTPKSDSACVVPWGVVRLLDAAASGADPDAVAAAIAPGQPDDAPSDVKLSEAARLLAADLGIARQNADQLIHLERALAPAGQ